MATVKITFRAPTNIGGTSVYSRQPRASQTITSSASSQASTITALAGEIATITASGGAVHVIAGSAPTAATTTGDLVPDGGSIELGFMLTGDKIAIIDA